jgi:hypothetical protein
MDRFRCQLVDLDAVTLSQHETFACIAGSAAHREKIIKEKISCSKRSANAT